MLHNVHICILCLELVEKLKLTWKKTWALSVLVEHGSGELVPSCGWNEYDNNKHLKNPEKKKKFH